MSLSIVIIAKNNERTIEAVVQNGYQLGADEVIVVDTGSSDNTCELADRAYARVVKYYGGADGTFDFSSARNRGQIEANGEWIFYLDTDEWVNPIYREEIAKQIAESAAGVYAVHHITYNQSGKAIHSKLLERLHRRGHCMEGLVYETICPGEIPLPLDVVIENKPPIRDILKQRNELANAEYRIRFSSIIEQRINGNLISDDEMTTFYVRMAHLYSHLTPNEKEELRRNATFWLNKKNQNNLRLMQARYLFKHTLNYGVGMSILYDNLRDISKKHPENSALAFFLATITTRGFPLSQLAAVERYLAKHECALALAIKKNIIVDYIPDRHDEVIALSARIKTLLREPRYYRSLYLHHPFWNI